MIAVTTWEDEKRDWHRIAAVDASSAVCACVMTCVAWQAEGRALSLGQCSEALTFIGERLAADRASPYAVEARATIEGLAAMLSSAMLVIANPHPAGQS